MCRWRTSMETLNYKNSDLLHNFKSDSTLSSLIQRIEDQQRIFKKVVCSVKVNGLLFSSEDEKKYKDLQVNEITSLEVGIESIDLIIFEVNQKWLESIPKLITQAESLALQIRYKGVEGVFKKLVQLVEDYQLLVDTLISLKSLKVSEEITGTARWDANEELTVKCIHECIHSLQKKDYNTLSDVLEYDIAHTLQEWHEFLQRLAAKQIENHSTRDSA